MYRLLHDNCQTFCLRLLECIRTPMGLCDIFEGLECIPQEMSNEILLQRCEEFSPTLTAGDVSVVASLERMPLCIGTIVRLSAQLVPVVLVAFFMRSTMAILVSLVIVCFYAECSRNAPVKPLSRFIWRPPQQDKLFLTVYRQLYPDEESTAEICVAADPPNSQSKVTLARGPRREHSREGSET